MGVVSCSAIGIRGALEHLNLPDIQNQVRVTAACDLVSGRAAAAAAQKYGVPRWYLTYEELLVDLNADLVTLCTPTPIGLHFEQGMQAIAAGKHVH